MRTIKILTLLTLSLFIGITSCKKDDSDTTPKELKNYSGSGSNGDLITFEINHTDNTYSINNETTNKTENGSYTTMLDSSLNGIYKVNANGSDFYAIELNDKIIAANFPTGNPLNTISYGVSSKLDNTDNVSNIAGDYLFMTMSEEGIMDDPSIKQWGILNINSDKSWKKKDFATNTGDGSVTEMSPDLFTGALEITSSDETGTWEVDGTNKERLNVKVNGLTNDLTGYVYAGANEAAFLLDLGTGNGFLLALKITNNATINSIAGDYKFINVWQDGKGAGNYSINNSGLVNWIHKGSDGNGSGSFQLTQCNNVFKNVFYAKSVEIEPNYFEDIYCVIVGDMIMHFSFEDSNGDFAQYGTGARLN